MFLLWYICICNVFNIYIYIYNIYDVCIQILFMRSAVFPRGQLRIFSLLLNRRCTYTQQTSGDAWQNRDSTNRTTTCGFPRATH